MSFILDALKKSESDRQRQSGPSLFEVKVTPPRRQLPIWAVAIAVLLGVNVIVISWMLLRHPASQQPAASAQSTTAAPPARNPVQEPPAVRQAIAPPGQGSAGSEQSGTVPAPSSGTAPPPLSGAAAPSFSGAAPPSPSGPTAPASSLAREGSSGQPSVPAGGGAQNSGPAAAGDNPNDYTPAVEPPSGSAAARNAGGDLPLYQQIVTSDGLPALHLDLHVFASRPQDRFAMINMHRVGEGDSLPSGVHVEAIRPDGVVLSYQGTRFLLPRN